MKIIFIYFVHQYL